MVSGSSSLTMFNRSRSKADIAQTSIAEVMCRAEVTASLFGRIRDLTYCPTGLSGQTSQALRFRISGSRDSSKTRMKSDAGTCTGIGSAYDVVADMC